jgi:hypothetical protein
LAKIDVRVNRSYNVVLSCLRSMYGTSFLKTIDTRVGKFSDWFEKNRHLFNGTYQNGHTIPEEELVDFISTYYRDHPGRGKGRGVTNALLARYGPFAFSCFGFGSLEDFIKKHGILYDDKKQEHRVSRRELASALEVLIDFQDRGYEINLKDEIYRKYNAEFEDLGHGSSLSKFIIENCERRRSKRSYR